MRRTFWSILGFSLTFSIIFLSILYFSFMLAEGAFYSFSSSRYYSKCENAKINWYALCATKDKTECENTDIDGDGVIDCKWDSSENNKCNLITVPNGSFAGLPPECRKPYKSPPLIIELFVVFGRVFAPFIAVSYITNLVFVIVLFYLQKKREIKIREFMKKIFLIIGFDAVAILLSIFILPSVLKPFGLSYYTILPASTIFAICAFWLFNTLFVKVHFNLCGAKADIIIIVVSLAKTYIYFFTPFPFYFLLAQCC